MRRTDRLFELIQLFRGGQLWRGADLAEKLEVSVRTIYRDIETLVASGIAIEGERGIGYLLREPIFLPPLTLTPTELEAFHFGMALVQTSADEGLAQAAGQLLHKIDNVLPTDRQRANFPKIIAVYAKPQRTGSNILGRLRSAVAAQRKVTISYESLQSQRSHRTIRPLHLEFWGNAWTLTSWCEKRSDFRTFRVDHIAQADIEADTFTHEVGKTYQDFLSLMSDKPLH
jgi:predicted DNA-binding transcriptional regulator YafY